MNSGTKIWLHGIGAAFISAFSTSASGALALPSVFNFSSTGITNMAKLSAIPAFIAVFAYLKNSPLPPLKITEEKTSSVSVTGSAVTASESTVTTTQPADK